MKPVKCEPPAIPVIENIHQKVFDAVSKPNALNMQAWHTCETRHCRAGWVVQLAGEAGKALEDFYDTPLAASLIYQASSALKVTIPRFYDSREVAMSDMQRLADEEAALKGAGHA